MAAQELLNANEVGRRVGVSAGTVRSWARAGRIPRIWITPKVVRFDWTAVLASLRAGLRDAEPRKRSTP